MKLLQIPPDITDQVWGTIVPMLEPSLERSRGTETPQTLLARIKTNHAQLWAVVEDQKPHTIRAAITTSLIDYPSGKRALMIEHLGGVNMEAWRDLKSEIEAWSVANGCSMSFCWIRKGLIKHLPDYKLSHYVVMKDLAA